MNDPLAVQFSFGMIKILALKINKKYPRKYLRVIPDPDLDGQPASGISIFFISAHKNRVSTGDHRMETLEPVI